MIGSQCCKFFVSYNKLKSLQPIHSHIKSDLNLPDIYDKELWTVITCAGKTFKQGVSGSEFSLSNPIYKKLKDDFNIKLNKVRVSTLIKLMDENGYLDFYRGYGTPKPESSNWMRSCVIFTDKMRVLFKPNIMSMFKSDDFSGESVVVKDSGTGECLLQYTKMKGVGYHRNLMKNYNDMLSKYEITLMSRVMSVAYKRIFHDSLEGGGRFYTFGRFQTLPSDLRKDLLIDKSQCTEVDISNLHGNILRVLQDLPKGSEGFDQYGIEEYPRYFCKAAMMCMINCKTKQGAGKAVFNICKDSEWDFTVNDCHKVVSLLESHNKPIKFFGKDSSSWKTLQNLDSRICEYIIIEFVKQNKPILCYHDSWVVKVEDRDLLIDTIFDAWKWVMKVNYNCKVKVEF